MDPSGPYNATGGPQKPKSKLGSTVVFKGAIEKFCFRTVIATEKSNFYTKVK